MPLTRRSLALAAEPASVPLARAWVSEVFSEIGRSDLAPAAQLGVSELVTNAILHASPPLTVSVSGTVEHPRVEVVDHAPKPIRPRDLTLVDPDEPSTFGRGLALLAVNARRWGSETLADGMGKRIWFEPSDRMEDDVDLCAMFADIEDDTVEDAPLPPRDAVRVVLLNFPAHLFGQLRQHQLELRRELRLLALADPGGYPLAVRLTELFASAEAHRRAASGIASLDEAVSRGLRSVDVELAAPAAGPSVAAELADLLERTYEAFAEEYLLATAPSADLRSLQAWYFGEIVAQGRGEPPRAWDGPLESAASSVG